MTDYPERKLHRLKKYDYTANGYYFITVCTRNKEKILSSVGNTVLGVPPAIKLSNVGEIVLKAWKRMSEIDSRIRTDEFCIMPNHFHGIIVIDNGLADETEHRGRRSLQSLVSGFKSVTTREYNKLINSEKTVSLWQSSFYDTVIRDEAQLFEIRKYISENPIKWKLDKYYE